MTADAFVCRHIRHGQWGGDDLVLEEVHQIPHCLPCQLVSLKHSVRFLALGDRNQLPPIQDTFNGK